MNISFKNLKTGKVYRVRATYTDDKYEVKDTGIWFKDNYRTGFYTLRYLLQDVGMTDPLMSKETIYQVTFLPEYQVPNGLYKWTTYYQDIAHFEHINPLIACEILHREKCDDLSS